MNQEFTYEQLSQEEKLAVEGSHPSPKHSLYLRDEDGRIAGYRAAEMFNAGVPMRWAPAKDLQTGEVLPVAVATVALLNGSIVEILKPEGGPVAGGIVRFVAFTLIERSVLNPRKHFDRERLNELKQSVKAHGLLPEMSHFWVRPHPTKPDCFELIDGERRLIVVGELINEGHFPATLEVPIAVSEVSDGELLEFALVNDLSRQELTQIEKAEGVCHWMECPLSTGAMPTGKDAEAKFGLSHTQIERFKLYRRLRGTKAGEAFEANSIDRDHAELLGRIPDKKVINALTKRVLHPTDGKGPVHSSILATWIQDEVERNLAKAQFDVLDEALVPLQEEGGCRIAGGACGQAGPRGGFNPKEAVGQWACPFITVKPGGGTSCWNRGCFDAKVRAAFAAWRKEEEAAGHKTYSAEAEAQLWDHTGKRLRPDSKLVEIDAKPLDSLLKQDTENRSTWKKLIKDRGVQVYAARDQEGAVHHMVMLEEARTAAVENGHDIFRGAAGQSGGSGGGSGNTGTGGDDAGSGGSGSSSGGGESSVDKAAEDLKREQKRETERQREAREAAIEANTLAATDRALVDATRGLKRLDLGYWRLVLAPMAEVVREEGHLTEACAALGLGTEDASSWESEKLAEWLNETIMNTPDVHLASVALILARHMIYDSEQEQWLRLACKTFKLEPKKIRKTVVVAFEAEEAAEALRLEIANGIEWIKRVEDGKEFEFGDDSYCTSGNLATAKMPKGVKHVAMIATARLKKGWAFGFELSLGKKSFVSIYPSRNEAIYDNEALAIKAALLAIQKAMEDHGAPEPARERIAAYVAAVKLPEDGKAKKRNRRKDDPT